MKNTILILLAILISALLWWKWPYIRAAIANPPKIDYAVTTDSGSISYKKAYFAAGCFWCTESAYEHYQGVVDAISGYAGGTEVDPTYEQVGRQETGHREAIEVIYDPTLISYADLVEIFWRTANPTDDGGQFVDRGFQYTSAIWYQADAEKSIAEASKLALEKSGRFGSGKLVTPILSFTTFYPAEDYHQNYYKVNPLHYQIYTNGSGRKAYQQKVWGTDYEYITKQANTPVSSRYTVPTQAELKAKLTPIQYSVTQEGDTERPFSNEYDKVYSDGIYVDIVSGVPLYSSRDKFDSGTGWPSFTRPIETGALALHQDNTLFSTRTEVRGALSDAHIGHVFDDGPVDKGGKRYCMNSAALRFIPLADMEREGYGEWIAAIQ